MNSTGTASFSVLGTPASVIWVACGVLPVCTRFVVWPLFTRDSTLSFLAELAELIVFATRCSYLKLMAVPGRFGFKSLA